MKKMLIGFVILLSVVITAVLTIQFFGILEGRPPETLGLKNNGLLECPKKQNCVYTNSNFLEFRISPLPFNSTANESIKKIRDVILDIKGAKLITENPDYIHVEFKSSILGFVDDLEIYCDPSKQQCLVRSASRMGYSDFGVNRTRVEKIRELLQGD